MSPLSATLTAAVLAFGGAPPMARHAALGSGRQTCAAQSVRMLGDREARTALKRELGVPNHPQLAAIATRRDAKKKESTGQRLVDVRIEVRLTASVHRARACARTPRSRADHSPTHAASAACSLALSPLRVRARTRG